jgi:ectoine hydroxylase-related dioxygenase (phytanoyl-CoA dioxygenase family)
MMNGSVAMDDETQTSMSSAGLARYRMSGYAILPAALSRAEVDALNVELLRLLRGELGSVQGAPEAIGLADPGLLRSTLCVHMPHKVSALFRSTMYHPAITAALTCVIGPDVKAMQTMAFVKSAGKPGQAWHQDEAHIPTRDRSLTAAWIALDEATADNGGLWALPGSHRAGVLYPDRDLDDARFDCTKEAYNFPYRDHDAIPLTAAPGDVILFDGHLLHRSLPNYRADGMRRALVIHYMNARSLLPWQLRDGENAATADYRDIELITGSDPYAWKGTDDRQRPHVRPDRDGGCLR